MTVGSARLFPEVVISIVGSAKPWVDQVPQLSDRRKRRA